MKYRPWVMMGVVVSSVVGFAAADATKKSSEQRSEAWVTEFQRYTEQEKLGNESTHSRRQVGSSPQELIDVLRLLPEPKVWPDLRQTFASAVAQVPSGEKLRKERLQAGSWLLTYLAGDRKELEAAIKAVVAESGQEKLDQKGYLLRQLLESLSGREESGSSPEKQLEAFEQQLAMLEPVDEAAAKKILGSEENFTRVKHLIEMGREMQSQYLKISEEFEKGKDEAAAEAKVEAMYKDYKTKIEVDLKTLEPYLTNALVLRFMRSLESNEPDEAPNRYIETLYFPDLVVMVGGERAEVLIRRALRLPVNIQTDEKLGRATRDLLRDLVLAEIGTLKVPSWSVVQDENSTALFEAFEKKFPAANHKDYSYHRAGSYYIAGLIKRGRVADAVKFTTSLEASGGEEHKFSLPYDVSERLEQTHADELWEFFRLRLAANPALDEWDRFTRLSVQLNRQVELMAMIKALAANEALRGLERMRVQQLQADAELATDDLSSALGRLRALVQTPAEAEPERALQTKIAERLLQLADLQGDAAGSASALLAAESLLEKGKNDKPEQRIQALGGLASTLNELGQSAESARLGRAALDQVAELEKAARAAVVPKASESHSNEEAPNEPQRMLDSLANYSLGEMLAQQLCAEGELGHWAEAASLLQESSWWGVKDTSELVQRRLTCKGRPVGYYVARVAQAQGDLALTRRLLEAQLVATPAADSVYEFYLNLVGQEALPLLEKLAATDRYEERPLIWKARLQLEAKQVDAAIITLQQAITIDPSDGEQGRGDRMRVYAFMSEAMAAKGDAEKSAFFANVVKAIRLSETADLWLNAGALTHALELYRKSLGFFQDAYCIQSRLAVRLAGEGKMDEAVEHYRRAFELMPDSFGRVESHCFGCEHVFAGKKSQGVAEEVFARMLKARPEKAQLHYLSGYLREEQKREAEAAEYYRQAVKLDPLYLNAWNRLAGLESELNFTPEQKDDLLLKLIELDPAHRHVSVSLEKVSDLSRLWFALQETRRVLDQLPKAGPLWELKASAAQLAKKKDNNSSSWYEREERKDFAVILRDHPFVQALQDYLVGLKPSESGKIETTDDKTVQ